MKRAHVRARIRGCGGQGKGGPDLVGHVSAQDHTVERPPIPDRIHIPARLRVIPGASHVHHDRLRRWCITDLTCLGVSVPTPSCSGGGRIRPGNSIRPGGGTLTRMTTEPRRRVSGRRIVVIRQAWAERIATSEVTCPRCDLQVKPDQAWDLGHQEDLALGGHPLGPMVPEHTTCNRRAGGQLGACLRPRSRRRLGEWMTP